MQHSAKCPQTRLVPAIDSPPHGNLTYPPLMTAIYNLIWRVNGDRELASPWQLLSVGVSLYLPTLACHIL